MHDYSLCCYTGAVVAVKAIYSQLMSGDIGELKHEVFVLNNYFCGIDAECRCAGEHARACQMPQHHLFLRSVTPQLRCIDVENFFLLFFSYYFFLNVFHLISYIYCHRVLSTRFERRSLTPQLQWEGLRDHCDAGARHMRAL